MPDNTQANIVLIVGGFYCSNWDEVSIDSDLEVPADSWSLTLYSPAVDGLPDAIQRGALIELRYENETVLKGVVDRIQEPLSRQGGRLTLSGRDLVAVLLDNSVPVLVQQQVTIEELALKWVLTDFSSVIHNFLFLRELDQLQNLVAIEPSESIWSALTKAAESVGQYIWIDAAGTLIIGNPFTQPQPAAQNLIINRHGNDNNVLSAEYIEDIAEEYSDVVVLGQDNQTQASFYATATDQNYGEVYTGQDLTPSAANQPDPPEYIGRTQQILPYRRRKIVLDSLADTAEQANARARKLMQDGNLSAYSLNCEVEGWKCQIGKVWSAGWAVQFDSDVMSRRVTGDWVIMGRTLRLSRASGKTTQLRLKRQQFWMQPIAPSPQSEQDDAEPVIDEVY